MNCQDFIRMSTPFAVIDVPILQRNINNFAQMFANSGINLRPHIKTHKCSEIAQRQIQAGAVGITTATILEAQDMADTGVNDIFMAYAVVGEAALAAFFRLHQQIKISCAIDSVAHIEALAGHASANISPCKVRIEINCGHNRCGALPVEDDLLPLISCLHKHRERITLEGVFTHAGHAYATIDSNEIERIAHNEAQAVKKAAQIITAAGLPCPIISVGSTPTARFSLNHGITEARPGNYVFFDNMQVANGSAKPGDCALKIVSRVIGKYSDHLVIDAGSKSLGLDQGAHGSKAVNGYGSVEGHNKASITRLSEEHGIINFASNEEQIPGIGDFLIITPNHSCAAANLFSAYQLWNGEKVIGHWSLTGRR